MTTAPEQTRFLDDLATRHGFALSGWIPLERPVSFEIYQQWIQDGLHGEMDYLKEHMPLKERPQRHYPFAVSALSFAFPYRPHPRPVDTPIKTPRTASYAQGADYHHWLKGKLNALIADLKQKWPEETFDAHTDTAPLLERDLAHQAGMGWFGKNTCLIHPKQGSFFLLGEILTSLPAGGASLQPLPDFCGKCTRCLEVCPTGALVEPRKLDARKCISYLTIESREIPPVELRDQIGDWFFGCDLCQTVCPWNEKPFKVEAREKISSPRIAEEERARLCDELRWILKTSGNQLEKILKDSPMRRAGNFGLKRNALIVAGNRRLTELAAEVQVFLEHPRLGELASWAFTKMNSAHS